MVLLRENIYDAVRADILACRLAPGTDMREQDLADRYAVSRAPVRDALLRLERERLVTVHPRQGSRVSPISIADARHVFQYRSILEPACVSLAAECSVSEMPELEPFRRFAAGTDFIAYNRGFHAALARASGNPRMAEAACDLIDQSERLVRVSLTSIKGRDPAQLVAEHGAIIDAIACRDARSAVRLLRDHIAKAERRVLAALARSAVVS